LSRAWGPPPGRRPPWWPEGEAFPRRRWRGGPPAFIRMIGCFFLAALALAALAGGVVGSSMGRFGPRPVIGFAVVVALVVGLAVSAGLRRMSRPMDNLIEATRRVEAGDYSARVPEWGPPELRAAARAFNSMSARLKASDDQRREFLADVTHELRTPLTVIRGQAEGISDGVYPADAAHIAPILDAAGTLDRLVEDLRTMVLTDAGNLVLNREPADLGLLVHDAVESFRSVSEGAGVALTAEVDPGLPALDLDPARIRGVLANLLSNAIHHTPRGGSVRLAAVSSNGQVTIRVIDTGAGIPPDLLPHVFERFAKGPGSTGSGLGLAIARDVVVAHGGRLEVESTGPSGTTVAVTLPVPRTS
jgi:two-component system, OmpR family, sensor histidine kinase BaeS